MIHSFNKEIDLPPGRKKTYYMQDLFNNLNEDRGQFCATGLPSSITMTKELDPIRRCFHFILVTCLNHKMSFGKIPILDKHFGIMSFK